MKTKIRYIGSHQPRTILEVEESTVKELMETGLYELVDKKVVKKDKPGLSWTEKEIKAWIEKEGLPLEYDIKRDTKKEMLERIKAFGR